MEVLKRERDLAQSQLDELRKKATEDQTVRKLLLALKHFLLPAALKFLICKYTFFRA